MGGRSGAALSDAQVISASGAEPACFGELFDRHAGALHRYLARRVGASEADRLVGDVFCVAFDKRDRYDCERASALPWLYGIASNLLAKHRRSEARRLAATARLLAQEPPPDDPIDGLAATLDASALWPRIADAVNDLPDGEREALLLYAWEELTYDEIAAALAIPTGTVRSRLNRARRRVRGVAAEVDPLRRMRPDRVRPEAPPDPVVLEREKERLMQAIDWNRPEAEQILRVPDVHARLAYRDERAALDHLVEVFGFTEVRDARTDLGGHILAFLRMGDGYLMISREDPEVHRIHSPAALGASTVMLQVRVHDIDAHYARAVAAGADITMPLEDAFYGERRYEANDLEGHRWHFAEPFTDIRARGGTVPEEPTGALPAGGA